VLGGGHCYACPCNFFRDDYQNGVLVPGNRLYAEQDANFNTTALVNTSGQVVERYVYSPYGAVTVLDASGTALAGSAFGWKYAFQGGRLDPVTGDILYAARNYDPIRGVWMQEDPLGLAAGDSNLYRYVGNDPANAVDPSGLISLFFEGAGQPLHGPGKQKTTIQTVFSYSTDPNKFLFLNPDFHDDEFARRQIVRRAVEEVIKAQTKRPGEKVYLYGWSRGGVEAIEVANQLAALGIRVEFVGVIDPVSTPVVIPGGLAIENNVTYFFSAGRSGAYDPSLNAEDWEKIADMTVFLPPEIHPNYRTMSPKQQAGMNFKRYPTPHTKSGWPTSNPDIYNDLLSRARQAGAPFPTGPLPPTPRQTPNPKGTVITPG
jgi:RHS repeat-associated protein